MSGKWTPGKWSSASYVDGPAGVYSDGDLLVAEVYSGGDAEPEDNARLIAAAPELYEALALLKERRCADFTLAEWKQIDAALAKARGETP